MASNQNKGLPLDRTYANLLTITPNTQSVFALDTNSLLQELGISVSGSVTLAGQGANGTLLTEGPENLLSNVQLNGTGKLAGTPTVNFSNTDASYLRMKTTIMEGTPTARTLPSTANGTNAFATSFKKYFGLKRIKGINSPTGISDATYLETRTLNTLNLNVTGRDVTSLVTPGAGGTATLGAVTAQIHSVEWVSGAIVKKSSYVSETYDQTDLTGLSGLAVRFRNVPLGNILLRQYFKGCVGANNYSNPSDAFFTQASQPLGSLVQTQVNQLSTKLSASYQTLQQQDSLKFGIAQWPAGWAIYEYSRTGLLKDALNLSGSSITACDNLIDITPVAGDTNTLYRYYEQLVMG